MWYITLTETEKSLKHRVKNNIANPRIQNENVAARFPKREEEKNQQNLTKYD
jgi:hypothetical protein